jgi:hypothetical protein
MTASTQPRLRFAAGVVAFASALAALSACSGSAPSPVAGLAVPTGSPVVVNGPADIARRAVQAQIDGDRAAYRELVRPDRREYFSMHDLRGCDLESAQILIEDKSAKEAVATVVFSGPCGTSPLGELENCRIRLIKLSGRWYIEGGDLGVYCESRGP